MKMSKSKKIEDIYQKKTPHEHILTLPDTYIGGIEEDINPMWVFDDETKKIVYRDIRYIPGLYKIFDEIAVNARDHTVRDPTCKIIKVNINQETGEITCYNNGNDNVPVAIHEEEKVYVPEMIFGHLLTSGNYNEKKKTTGGKNGYGSKLCNVFSSHFCVEVADAKRKKKYEQHFYKNMYDKRDPIISNSTAKSYLKITFTPDYSKFGCDALSDDMVALFKKRVYDIAACTPSKVKVYLNDELLTIDTFEQYIKMYYLDDEEYPMPKYVYFEMNRWKIGAVYDPNTSHKQISFVNGICTFKGGSHINHVLEQILSQLCDAIAKKHKNLNVRRSYIKDNLTIFIESVIEDPSFSSQTKEEMTSKVSTFGSRCEIDDQFINKLIKTGIIDEAINFAKLKSMAELKKSDGKKVQKLRDMEKLVDAKWAGTRRSAQTRLILTEGDSAKSFAMSGISIIGREKYGIYPLRGKLLNVRDASAHQLKNNKEIQDIKKIMGLQHGKEYDDTSSLRYGGIMILADSDVDGFHIKGLIMNFFEVFWPSLVKIDGFFESLGTPIVKAWKKTDTKKKNIKEFYNLIDYDDWIKTVSPKLWDSKYYKGLGTHTGLEAKAYFRGDFESKIVKYLWDKHEVDSEEETPASQKVFDLVFNKKRADDRKRWMMSHDPKNVVDNIEKEVEYTKFFNMEMIQFSLEDVRRSVPSIDGFKPSQRKIMYVAYKHKLFTKQIKVSQLAGYVSAESAYHHGEASLTGAIIKMAQNFVGSNNINLLLPDGQFGTRIRGGKDAASPRYIFTRLSDMSPLIFNSKDECVLNYQYDDGDKIEPDMYAPIIPMILINGSRGIGTGFSCDVPCYNPKDIIANLKRMLKGKKITEMIPWYQGFKGTITKDPKDPKRFFTSGVVSIVDARTVVVTELPVGKWTEPYKSELESLIVDDLESPESGKFIEDLDDNYDDDTLKFTIKFIPGALQKLVKNNEMAKKLKLINSFKTSNMYLHNHEGKITKYNNIEDIMIDYYNYRLEVYRKRKTHYTRVLKNQLDHINWKVKFLEMIISGKLIIIKNNRARKRDELEAELQKLKFPKLSHNVDADEEDKTYNYLLNIPIKCLTEEELEKLRKEYQDKLDEYSIYVNTSEEQIWYGELEELEKAYIKWDNDRESQRNGEPVVKKPRKTKATKKTSVSVKTEENETIPAIDMSPENLSEEMLDLIELSEEYSEDETPTKSVKKTTKSVRKTPQKATRSVRKATKSVRKTSNSRSQPLKKA